MHLMWLLAGPAEKHRFWAASWRSVLAADWRSSGARPTLCTAATLQHRARTSATLAPIGKPPVASQPLACLVPSSTLCQEGAELIIFAGACTRALERPANWESPSDEVGQPEKTGWRRPCQSAASPPGRQPLMVHWSLPQLVRQPRAECLLSSGHLGGGDEHRRASASCTLAICLSGALFTIFSHLPFGRAGAAKTRAQSCARAAEEAPADEACEERRRRTRRSL